MRTKPTYADLTEKMQRVKAALQSVRETRDCDRERIQYWRDRRDVVIASRSRDRYNTVVAVLAILRENGIW